MADEPAHAARDVAGGHVVVGIGQQRDARRLRAGEGDPADQPVGGDDRRVDVDPLVRAGGDRHLLRERAARIRDDRRVDRAVVLGIRRAALELEQRASATRRAARLRGSRSRSRARRAAPAGASRSPTSRARAR